MTYPTPTHSKDCSYHLDQYSWECDCGAYQIERASITLAEMCRKLYAALDVYVLEEKTK